MDATNPVTHQADMTNVPDVERFTKPIGKLINASGIIGIRPILEYIPSHYDVYLDLNRGFFFIT